MPGPSYAALTPATAGVVAHGWPIEIVIAGCAVARDTTASRALGDAIAALLDDGSLAFAEPSERAIVVGTESAAIAETLQFGREIEEVGATLVNPALFPLTVMNATSGLAAIRHQCEGPNVTVSNGPASVLDALVYAADLLLERRATLVFAGGFETQAEAPPSESAVALACAVIARDRAEAAGAPALARLVATASAAAGLPCGDAGDPASPLVAAAAEAGRSALAHDAAAHARIVAVHHPGAALAALADATHANVPMTVIVARRQEDSAGTALILIPPRGERAGRP